MGGGGRAGGSGEGPRARSAGGPSPPRLRSRGVPFRQVRTRGSRHLSPHPPRKGGAAQEDIDPRAEPLPRWRLGATSAAIEGRQGGAPLLHHPGGGRSAPVSRVFEQIAEGSGHQLPPVSGPTASRGLWI